MFANNSVLLSKYLTINTQIQLSNVFLHPINGLFARIFTLYIETFVTKSINTLLPYNDRLTLRDTSQITTIVIHCTELPDMETARTFGEKIHYDSQTGNSGHYYISKQGDCYQWVSLDRVAHHVASNNQHTVGIELDNLGRYPHWHSTTHQIMHDPYPGPQIDALIQLILKLQKHVPSLQYITGHEDLDTAMIPAENNPKLQVRKKVDPGPLFPWDQVMQNISLINIGSLGNNAWTK